MSHYLGSYGSLIGSQLALPNRRIRQGKLSETYTKTCRRADGTATGTRRGLLLEYSDEFNPGGTDTGRLAGCFGLRRGRITEPMRRCGAVAAILVLAAFLGSCGDDSSSHQAEQGAKQAPAIPADVLSAAESALGSEAEVLVYGDLAKTGKEQVLAINRLKTTPEGVAPGILLSRASIIEKRDDHWVEIFHCDEHLKNTKGFLAGTPIAPVSSWRLQYEQDGKKGLEMYFTPLEKPAGGYIVTLAVEWNASAKRYQALGRDYREFQGETLSLEIPESRLQ